MRISDWSSDVCSSDLGFNPLARCAVLFQLPERCPGLQPVDQEFRGLEGRLAMGRGGDHADDAVAGCQLPITVYDEAVVERPALARLGDAGLELALGHAGVMLKRHALVAG